MLTSIEDFLEDVQRAVANDTYDFQHCHTAMDRMGPYHKIDVIAALIKTNGNYSLMAPLLNRNRGRIRDYVMGNRDVLEFRDDLRQSRLDIIEEHHWNAAEMGDLQAGKFLLTTIGAERGYRPQTALTGPDGGAVQTETVQKIDPASLSMEQLQALVEILPDD